MKTVFSVILAFAMTLTIGLTAFAGDASVANLDEQLQDIDQQLAVIIDNPDFSLSQKKIAEEKAQYLKSLLSGQRKATSRSTSQSNYVPYYKQLTDYYCGPASIQQTLGHYYYSPIPEQSAIAREIGPDSDTNLMCSYLNRLLNPSSEPGYICYSVWWNSSSQNMQTTIVSIAGTGTPIIVHVGKITSTGRTSYTDTAHWAYTTTGHYMSISGYVNNGAQIELTDPFIMWSAVGKSDSRYSGGKYQINFSTLNAVGDRLIT